MRYDQYISWWWIHSCTSLSVKWISWSDVTFSEILCTSPESGIHRKGKSMLGMSIYFCQNKLLVLPEWKRLSAVNLLPGRMVLNWGQVLVSLAVEVGHLVAVAARLALANGSPGYPQYLPPWPPHSYSHHTSTVVADDRSWLTSTVWVILAACLFSVSPIIDALWWVLAYDTKIFIIFTCSHMSINMPLPQTPWFPAFQSFSL